MMSLPIIGVQLLAFSFFGGSPSDSGVVAKKVDSGEIVRLLNDIHLSKEVRTEQMIVRIWDMADSPGSAGQPSGEVTTTMLIAVSGYGEYPNQNVFRLSSLYAPKIERTNKTKESVAISFSFIDRQSLTTKRFTVIVSPQSVEITQ